MKINIIGTSGSGKSTLARRIATELSLPYIEMDRLYWRPDWQGTPDEVLLKTLAETLAATPGWVLDGNYNRTRPVKWREVDLVVWVDCGFLRTLWQAVTRAFKRAWHQQELWPGTGNRESFRRSFLVGSPSSYGPSKPGAAIANATKPICKIRNMPTFALSASPVGRRRRR